MPSAKDVTAETEWLKIMSVGESGEGKSIFASSFPTPGFVFDFGGEIISYQGLDFDYEQYEISGTGWGRFEVDLGKIKKCIREGTRIDGSAGKYETVVVDNLKVPSYELPPGPV